jgi:hypothetical protein
MNSFTRLALAASAVMVATTLSAAPKVTIKAESDRTVDVKAFRTYAWRPANAGSVMILQATGENPETVKARFDPVIRTAVQNALAKRGLSQAPAETADVLVDYYLLIGPGASSQFMGQFVAPVADWSLPPFPAATTALEVYEQGTLIVDMSAAAKQAVVWRGSAQRALDRTLSPAAADEVVRRAIDDMFKRYPRRR